jgi:hypothetical protein
MNDVTSYDDHTLDKVRTALSAVGLGEAGITDAITGMQNQGILFRERADSTPGAGAGDTRELRVCDFEPRDCGRGTHFCTSEVGVSPREITDGHHTFEELYDHRRALTAVLAAHAAQMPEAASWRSKAHHPDDSPMFEGGYFIVGIELDTGTITYHYKLEHWDDFAAVPELAHARKWDGASPADTVTRLLALAQQFAIASIIRLLEPDADGFTDGSHAGSPREYGE